MRAGRVIKYNDQFKSNAVRQVVTYFGKSGVQRAKSRSVELERAGDSARASGETSRIGSANAVE